MRIRVRFGKTYLVGNGLFNLSGFVLAIDNFAIFQKDDPPREFDIAREAGAQQIFRLVLRGAVFEYVHLIPSEIRNISDFDNTRRCRASIYALSNPLLDCQ